jgi:hypothetical protein
MLHAWPAQPDSETGRGSSCRGRGRADRGRRPVGGGLGSGGVQLWHAADARDGVATATFVPNQDDSAYVTVNIVFADGVAESVPMLLANPASAHSWRLQIGTLASPVTNAPPPVSPDPPAS